MTEVGTVQTTPFAQTEHYLDHASTTRPSEGAKAAAVAAWNLFANPSSLHAPGQAAARLLAESREKVRAAMGLARFSRDKVIFPSTGTEANCLAMLGCAYAKRRTATNGCFGKLLISDGEHPSMENPAKKLENEGYLIKRIPTRNGVLDFDALETALSEDDIPVIFAGFMLVNNETGAVYDVKRAAERVKRANPAAVVHCDGVQGFLKRKETPLSLGVDTFAVSAHKIHGIRGAAALYLSEDVLKRRNISPIAPGGGQEEGLRSGTENLAAIAAFAAAAEEEHAHFATRLSMVESLRRQLDEGLDSIPAVRVHLPAGERLPHICNFSVMGVRSEVMLNYLSSLGVYVSAGSACSSHAKKQSQALAAFGVDRAGIESAIRVSLSYENTPADIEALLSGIRTGAERLTRH